MNLISIIGTLILIVLLSLPNTHKLQGMQSTNIVDVAWSSSGQLRSVATANKVITYNRDDVEVGRVTSVAPIFAISWKPNGDQLAIASGNTISLWNFDLLNNAFYEQINFQATGDVIALDWDCSGNYIATIAVNSLYQNLALTYLSTWNVNTSQIEFTSQDLYLVDIFLSRNALLDWNTDGTQIVVIGTQAVGEVDGNITATSDLSAHIYDVQTQQLVRQIPLRPPYALSVAWRPFENEIAVGSQLGVVIYDTVSSEMSSSFAAGFDIQTLDWDFTGRNLIADSTVIDVLNGEILGSFQISDEIVAAHWSPDGLQVSLITLSGDTYVQEVNRFPAFEIPPTLTSTFIPSETLQIVFTVERGTPYNIHIMNADGSNVRELDTTDWQELSPACSPNGEQIAFSTIVTGIETGRRIEVMNANGSGRVPITDLTSYSAQPSWSPDGSRMVFTGNREGKFLDEGEELYVMNADGSNVVRLTDNSNSDNSPSWSPGGNHILFVSVSPVGNGVFNADLFVINPDGSNLMQMTSTTFSEAFPSWSPDGLRIAFTSNQDGDDEIYFMNADGSNITQLTNNTIYDSMPVWSPDGSRIAFVSNRHGNDNSAIYAMNTDGSNVQLLTDTSVNSFTPCWLVVSTPPTPTSSPTLTSSFTPTQTPTATD